MSPDDLRLALHTIDTLPPDIQREVENLIGTPGLDDILPELVRHTRRSLDAEAAPDEVEAAAEDRPVNKGQDTRMSEEASHTPTPWSIDRDDAPGMHWNNHIVGADPNQRVCFMSHDGTLENACGEANARLIVRAVNAHDALVKALISLHDATVDLLGDEAEHEPVIARARAALELARDMPGAPR